MLVMIIKLWRVASRKFSSSFSKTDTYILKMHENKQQTNIYKINGTNILMAAVQYLKDGHVISVPTDTVYGLACDANNEQAIHHLYYIKGRDFHKPVAICVKDLVAFRKYAIAEHLSDDFLKQLLPGPITIVLDRSKYLSNRFLNPSTNKIGIRIPDYPFIQQLCNAYNSQPLALTSANRSSESSSLHINEFRKLWPLLGGIFDAGPIDQDKSIEDRRSGSTVVDLSEPGFYNIIREGIALNTIINQLHLHGLKLSNNNNKK